MKNPLQEITEYTRNELVELGMNIKNEKEYMARKFEYQKDPLRVQQTIRFYRDDIKDCAICEQEEEEDLNITEEPRSATLQMTGPSQQELDESAIDFYQTNKDNS